ncbi:MAG TPA: beta-galactosidase, partial [Prevotella sp.]|nr:beta-galactosidase [Prevotella sp.]
MKTTLITLLLLSAATNGLAQTRQQQTLSTWQFSRDSTLWHPVSVPHDWAISGPFDKQWDLQTVAIVQNGEKEKTEKTGRSGALPWIGRGYYATSLTVGDLSGRRATLEFDGAMAEPVVYVNGQRAGSWAYGYTPFRVDITPYLHAGDNTLAVSLHNQPESSRWYP